MHIYARLWYQRPSTTGGPWRSCVNLNAIILPELQQAEP